MASKVEIISSAFILLGKGGIDSIGEDSPKDVLDASALYDTYYTIFLKYPWRFALKQQVLSIDATADTYTGYDHGYQLPSDYIQILRVDPRSDYRLFGTHLYSNIAADLKLIYTASVSESVIPEYYKEFLIEKMAALIAMNITQKPDLVKIWAQSSEIKLAEAMASDQQSQPSLIIQDNPILSSKFFANTGYEFL